MALLSGFVEKLGMYPQTVVPLGELHDILTANYANQTGGVIKTGASYTANVDGTAWSSGNQELNYEYSYLGDRYVKVTPYRYDATESANYRYNYSTAENPDLIGRITAAEGDAGHLPRWFKVKPIKWIILNINIFIAKHEEHGIVTDLGLDYAPEGATLELYATDVLISGIPFNTDSTKVLWTDSNVKNYLNGDFYNQAFSSNDKLQIQASKIYNNTSSSDYNNAVNGLNYNHLPTGGLNPTDQKIYLLSVYEMGNAASPYGTDGSKVFAAYDDKTADNSRQVSGTDYARAHYLGLYASGGSYYPYYWTRSAYASTNVSVVLTSGGISHATANGADNGTRPALTMSVFLYEAL